MSMVHEQSLFLGHVAELLRKASELGFAVSGGELYRTPEQQALHVKNGRSNTMNSQHLKRLAIDLNFFRSRSDGSLALTYDVEELRPLGEFWESLDPANRWGGNWKSFKDSPHFERRESGGGGPTPTSVPSSVPPPVMMAATGGSGRGLIGGAVGARSANRRDDVETVQRLLNLAAAASRFELADGPLKSDGIFGSKTLDGILAFRRALLAEPEPAPLVEASGPCIEALAVALPGQWDSGRLGLLYLRAADEAVAELAGQIQQVMANRAIDTPLRQAHFLAQIGHESGELRFRQEIASGEAYEGRRDLGNSQPGDGPRFKGRGLIQLTGRANYSAYGKAIGREAELLANPALVASDPELCVDVAGWFWAKRELNGLADLDDLTSITRRINGGLNGLDDRRRLLQRAKALLGLVG